jgi:hypothetical protein
MFGTKTVTSSGRPRPKASVSIICAEHASTHGEFLQFVTQDRLGVFAGGVGKGEGRG